jgi:L,D-transpeptidase catalytic domain
MSLLRPIKLAVRFASAVGLWMGAAACERLAPGDANASVGVALPAHPAQLAGADLRPDRVKPAPSEPGLAQPTLPPPPDTSNLGVRPRQFPSDGPRLYARTRNVWIRPKPDSEEEWTGYLWWGDSVKLREPDPIPGPGCASFYAIEPRGYVCTEGRRATVDPNDPLVQGLFPHSHDASQATPYPFYGEATGAERYTSLPSEEEQRVREWDYTQQRQRVERALRGEGIAPELQGIALTPARNDSLLLPTLPEALQLPHRRLVPRSTLAWTNEVRHTGRSWLLTDDLTWVAKDRIRPYAPITFRGVRLGEEARLPLAFFREQDRPSYRQTSEGVFEPDGQSFARLSWVELSGRTQPSGADVFHETLKGAWIKASEAVIPVTRERTPWGTGLLDPAQASYGPPERRSWMDVSILGGWLMAYEDTRPVYVTLISPGRGGPPRRGKDPLTTGSTPTGRFTINGKFATATMIAANDVAHSAVAWSQNFLGPYSIHTAYWHNAWGEPHSGGCINVAPLDGRWLFDFSDPKLPEGWHGVRWSSGREPTTVLMVRR